MFDVYISLTTIPTRAKILKRCLNSLLNQTYPIKKIILTIPQITLRSQTKQDIPPFLTEFPYNQIEIYHPKRDYGPVMKYIGSSNFISSNERSLVYVCDDDQQYQPDLVQRLVNKYTLNQGKVITANGKTILFTPTIYGHASILLPSKVIKLITDEVLRSSVRTRKSCQLVDDNWVSSIIKHNQIEIVNMNLGYDKLYINAKVYNPDDGLSKTTSRWKDILYCSQEVDKTNYYSFLMIILIIFFLILFNYK